jgi:hypothetical protein
MFMLVAVLLALSSTSYAAEYNWTGKAGDLNWNTPGNWKVTGSIYNWTWPNDEFEARRVNQDCDEIKIANGDMVARLDELVISGASDGSNEAVLTIDKSSGLSLSGLSNMWIGRGINGRGRAEVQKGSLLSMSRGLTIALDAGSVGALNIVDGTVNVGRLLNVGSSGVGCVGTVDVKNSTVNIGTWVQLGSSPGATGELSIKDSTLKVEQHFSVGHGGTGTMEMRGGILTVNGLLMVGRHGSGASTLQIRSGTVDVGSLWIGLLGETVGTVEMKGGTLNTAGDLNLARECVSGTLSIKDGVVNIGGGFQMNLMPAGRVSELVMDGGVVNVASATRVNWAGGPDSWADFTLNGGTWNSDGEITVGMTPNGGNAYLTINGGTMVTYYGTVSVGNPGSGKSRIFLNGGLLQGEGLVIDDSSDSLIVYRGGELWINKYAVDEVAMQSLITAGKIDVPAIYEITTVGEYTVLRLGI